MHGYWALRSPAEATDFKNGRPGDNRGLKRSEIVMSTQEAFVAVVDLICRRPGMFTGTQCLRDIAIYLDGLDHGVSLAVGGPRSTQAWRRWLEGRYMRGMGAQPWTEYLGDLLGSEAAVMEALAGLYREFFADLDALGEAGIHDRTSQRLVARHVPRDPDVRCS